MMNNKGQTLVIFVVFLPILILLIATVIDISLMYSEANELNNINKLVINYGLSNIEENNLENKLEKLSKLNDDNINEVNIKIEKNKIIIILEKKEKSIFGNVIGLKEYKIKSKYSGELINNKKVIKKG